MVKLILETTFLIDLERELHKGRPGAAQGFLARERQSKLFLTFTTLGELAAGHSFSRRETLESFVAPFRVLELDAEVCWRYGELFRFLKKNGLLIESNDMWIAATALAHDLPVVTRNVRHYQRVPGLEVVSY